MNINQLESYNLSDAVKFHDTLNPLLWDRRENLHPEIRDQLMAIASDFSEFLGVKDLDLKDITISGSNAAFSYTPHSDIDLHLIVDLSNVEHEDVYRELFSAKKAIYNKENTITIKGIPVEVYVQDATQDHHSQGIYSILNNEWIQIPRRIQADIDDMSVRSKYEDLSKRIKKVIKSDDLAQMNELMDKIRLMRSTGLSEKGEFGPENLAFKLLRNTGDLKKLQAARQAAKDQELSLKERVRNSTKYGYGTDYIEEVGMTPDGTNPTTSEFTNESQLDEVGLTPDGTNPTTAQFTNETQDDHKNIIKDFMEFCADQLGIDKDISLRIRQDPQWSVRNKTFGRYNHGTNELEVGIGGRHIMDVLRTVAHELVHQKQNQHEQMPADAGEDGSKYENEANARAGVLMRQYGKLHPELFAVGSDLDEYLAHITPYGATGGGMGTKTGIKASAGGLGTIGAFGSVAEELNKKVIAHGYEYNRRDQRESWTKEFASEAAAIEWARRRNATLLSVVPKQKLSENAAQNLPSVLYHATYKPRLKSIKLKGLGAGGKRNWEDSQRGVVYLALDPNVAESYAETSDMVPDEWLDSIVILKIATAGLDPNKFHIDSNVQDNTGDTVKYHGIIPPSNISLYNQGVAEGLEQQYLWHGSRQKIPMLEPRQAVDTGGAAGSNQNAIYATSDPIFATQMGMPAAGSDYGHFPNDPQMVLFSGKIRKGENVYLHKLPFYGPDGKPQFVQGGNDREFHSIPGVKAIKPVEIKAVPVDRYLNLVRQATPQDLELRKELTKEGVAEDSGAWPFQEINELSNDKLAQYKSAAGRAATAADRAGNYELGNKRFRGITQATKKQFANDVKKHKPQ